MVSCLCVGLGCGADEPRNRLLCRKEERSGTRTSFGIMQQSGGRLNTEVLLGSDEIKPPRGSLLDDGESDPPGCIDGPAITGSLALVNAALGAGVLAYPFAFMSAGMVAGNIVTMGMGVLCFCTLCIVMHSMATMQERYGANAVRSYGELVKLGLGNRAAVALEVMIIFYMFGACVGYLEVLEDVFNGFEFTSNSTLHTKWGKTGLNKEMADIIALAGAAILCFGLSTLRDISSLKYSAAAAVLAVLFTVGTLVYQAILHPCTPSSCKDETGQPGWTPGEPGVTALPRSLKDLIKALPLICFAMQCHIQCAAAYCEMPARIRRSVPKRRGVAIMAIVLILALYFPAGISGFVRFGDATNADILYNFNLNDYAADIAKVCMGLTALSAFPCQHYPARHIIHKVWISLCAPVERSTATNMAGTLDTPAAPPAMSATFAVVEAFVWTAVVLVVTIGAMIAGIHLDLVFQLIGAICGSTVILIIPGFLWARHGTGSAVGRLIPAVGLSATGLFILGAGTFVTLQEMMEK